MKRLLVIAIASLALPAASRAERRIAGRFQQVRHDCRRDATVEVAARLSRITLVGRCALVQVTGELNQVEGDAGVFLLVTGDQNQVRVAATDAIRVSGGQNEITYRRALTPRKRTRVTSSSPTSVIRRER